jgi:hypothetical protein
MSGEKVRVIKLGCRVTRAGERTIASRQRPSGHAPLSFGMLCLSEGHGEHTVTVLKQSADLPAPSPYTRQCSFVVSTLRSAVLDTLLDCRDICEWQEGKRNQHVYRL